MKRTLIALAALSTLPGLASSREASAFEIITLPPIVLHTFKIQLTNGSATEMSPAVAYTTAGAQSEAMLGSVATPGFIELCLNGPTAPRQAELASNPDVLQSVDLATPPSNFGLLEPGQSESFQLTMANAASTNIHVEMMYGKTKDVCSVINIPSDALSALVQGLKSDFVGGDQVVATGAYFDPMLPTPTTSGATACDNQPDARSCLRSLSALNAGTPRIRAFPGYLPSVLTALEQVYGSAATQQLIIPTSGAMQYRITLVGSSILEL